MPWKFFTAQGAEKQVPASVVNPITVIRPTATQTLTTGVSATVAFAAALIDTVGGWSAGSPNQITIKVAGTYLLEAAVMFDLNATGGREAYILVNGTNVSESGLGSTSVAQFTSAHVKKVVALNAGDVITVTAQQTSGGNLNIRGDVLYGAHLSVTKIDGAVVSYVAVPGNLVGQELAYAQIVSPVSVTDTNEATGTAIIAAPPITVDGSTPILVEFFSDAVQTPSVLGSFVGISLFEGATEVTRLCFIQTPAAASMLVPAYGRYRFIPSAGTHTYKIAAWTNTVTGGPAITGGPGGATGNPPASIRITRAA